MTNILVRPARKDDLPTLAALEQSTWSGDGAPPLSEADLFDWLQEGSPLFLVSEYEGQVCGYYFGRQIHFSFDAVDAFIKKSTIRDGGWYSECLHDPTGTVSYGISTISNLRGAGLLMSAHAQKVWRELGLTHSVGFTRLSGFDEYLRSLESIPAHLDEIALWYAHQNAKMLNLRTWHTCTPEPALDLPQPAKPDPVLAFHAKGNPIGLLRVVPNYMPDAASRNYAAFIALDTKDIPD